MAEERSFFAEDQLPFVTSKILHFIFSKRFDAAKVAIENARKKYPKSDAHRFIAFSATLHKYRGETDQSIALLRQAIKLKPEWLPHYSTLADVLLEVERWEEADQVLQELIDRSLEIDEAFFLNQSRFERLLCLKMLGRKDEFDRVNAQLAPDDEYFVGGKIFKVKDVIF